jgi:hypothetical protein
MAKKNILVGRKEENMQQAAIVMVAILFMNDLMFIF